MAARLLALLLVLVLVLLAVSVVVGLLAYGTTPARSGRVTVPALGAEATIRWTDDLPTIEAQSLADTYAALGYLHALESTWAMTLWRQAAAGRLAVWFGDAARPYDRHAHTLGFAAQARLAYDALSPEQQTLLQAYAVGVNRALRQPAVAQTDEFVLRDVEPEPWQPWDALVVERLIAYLGTEQPPLLAAEGFEDAAHTRAANDTTATTQNATAQITQRLVATTEARAFTGLDRLFRAALYLGDFRASYAWTAPHVASPDVPTARTWLVRLTYGASALPLVQEIAVERGEQRVVLATVPGTVMLPAALTQASGTQGGWLVMLTSSSEARLSDRPLPLQHARVVDRQGREELLSVRRGGPLLALSRVPEPRPSSLSDPPATDSLAADSLAVPVAGVPPSAPPASAPEPYLALQWRGFDATSDTPAWTALLADALGYAPLGALSFELFEGDGLRLSGDTWTVLGSPAVRRALPRGVFVGGEPALDYAADRLAGLLETAPAVTPATLALDRTSTWAARAVPSWIAPLDADLTPALEDANAYLRGWSFEYAPRAIAPTLFDRWTVTYAAMAQPNAAAPQRDAPLRLDSTAQVLARVSLARTLDSLRAAYGSDPATWRWENTQPQARYFPIWSSPTDTLIHGPAERRYAPARLGLGGHPTTLAGGTSPAFPGQGSAAVWTAWSRSDALARTTTIHTTVTTRGPLARALDMVNLNQPLVHAPPASNAATLRLVPTR